MCPAHPPQSEDNNSGSEERDLDVSTDQFGNMEHILGDWDVLQTV